MPQNDIFGLWIDRSGYCEKLAMWSWLLKNDAVACLIDEPYECSDFMELPIMAQGNGNLLLR